MNDKLDVVLIHHPTSDVHRPILFPAMGLFGLMEIAHLGVEGWVDPDFDILDHVARKCTSTD